MAERIVILRPGGTGQAPSLLDRVLETTEERRARLGTIPERVATRGEQLIGRGVNPWHGTGSNPWLRDRAVQAIAQAILRAAAPRMGGPWTSAALQLAPYLLEASGWNDPQRAALLLREVNDWLTGARGSAPRLHFWPQSASGWVLDPAYWRIAETFEDCPIEPFGPVVSLIGGGTGCASVGQVDDGVVASVLTTNDVMNTFGTGPGLLAAFSRQLGPGEPGTHFWSQGRVYEWIGPSYGPGGAPAAAYPSESSGTQANAFYGSPDGRGDPQPNTAARRNLARFGLPNSTGGERPLNSREQRIVNAARAWLGLSQVVEPKRQAPARGVDPDPPVWIAPGGSAEVYPRPRPARPHVYERPKGGARESKLRFTKAMLAARFAWNVFTETNDAIESIHKALPKECRKARQSSRGTGNKRTDSMLSDIWHCLDRVRWEEALVHMLANEVEDFYYGIQGKFAAQAGHRLRRGQGQGGIGTGNAISGQGEGWHVPQMEESSLDMRGVDPVMKRVAQAEAWAIQSLRRIRNNPGFD